MHLIEITKLIIQLITWLLFALKWFRVQIQCSGYHQEGWPPIRQPHLNYHLAWQNFALLTPTVTRGLLNGQGCSVEYGQVLTFKESYLSQLLRLVECKVFDFLKLQKGRIHAMKIWLLIFLYSKPYWFLRKVIRSITTHG